MPIHEIDPPSPNHSRPDPGWRGRPVCRGRRCVQTGGRCARTMILGSDPGGGGPNETRRRAPHLAGRHDRRLWGSDVLGVRGLLRFRCARVRDLGDDDHDGPSSVPAMADHAVGILILLRAARLTGRCGLAEQGRDRRFGDDVARSCGWLGEGDRPRRWKGRAQSWRAPVGDSASSGSVGSNRPARAGRSKAVINWSRARLKVLRIVPGAG